MGPLHDATGEPGKLCPGSGHSRKLLNVSGSSQFWSYCTKHWERLIYELMNWLNQQKPRPFSHCQSQWDRSISPAAFVRAGQQPQFTLVPDVKPHSDFTGSCEWIRRATGALAGKVLVDLCRMSRRLRNQQSCLRLRVMSTILAVTPAVIWKSTSALRWPNSITLQKSLEPWFWSVMHCRLM